MIADILSNISDEKKYRYELKLRKTNLELIQFIPFISINFTQKFDDYNSLSFDISDKIYDTHIHELIDNPIWIDIRAGHVVELNIYNQKGKIFAEYYSVEELAESGSEVFHTKTINCIPLHQLEFNAKKLRGFEDTRKLFDFDLQDKEKNPENPISPYVWTTTDEITEQKRNTTYNPANYTQGGILNYILEYILNKDTLISDADKEYVEVMKSTAGQQEKTNIYPNYFIGNIDYSNVNYNRIKINETPSPLLLNKKFWKIKSYDLDLLDIWSSKLNNKEDYTPDKIYDFLYGNIEFGTTENGQRYLVNGLMTYWEAWGNSYTGILIDDYDNHSVPIACNGSSFNYLTPSISEALPIQVWGSEENKNIVSAYSEDEGENVDANLAICGYTIFALGKQEKVEKPELYVPSDSGVRELVDNECFKFGWDFGSLWNSEEGKWKKDRADYAGDVKARGYEDWNPEFSGCITQLINDMSKGTFLSKQLFLDPMYGSILATRAEGCIIQLQNYINTVVSVTSASSGEVDERTGGTYTQAFLTLYTRLTSLYEKVIYYLWYPLYTKFISCQGRMPYRTMSFQNSSLTEVFKTLEKEFMCIFEFDNINKEIKILSRNNIKFTGEDSADNLHSQLILSPYNYLTNIDISRKTSQIITRLYLEGKNGLWITGVNPTGQRYIDDFSYYKNSEYMSEELKAKLDVYETELAKYDLTNETSIPETRNINVVTEDDIVLLQNATFRDFMVKFKKRQEDFAKADGLYQEIKKALNEAKTYWDTRIEEDAITAQALEVTVFPRVGELQSLIGGHFFSWEHGVDDDDLETAYTSYKKNYDAYEKTFEEIRRSFLYTYFKVDNNNRVILFNDPRYANTEKYFSEENISEIRKFIFEDDQSNAAISDETVLYLYGKDYLNYINTIPIDVNITLADILSVPTFYQDWERITQVGQKCRVHYPKLHLYMNKDKFTILSYTHSYSVDSQNLTLQLSNSKDLSDLSNNLAINTWVAAFKAYKGLDKYRDSWEEYLNNKDAYIQQGQAIDVSINPIKDNKGKDIINSAGIVLSKQIGNTIKNYPDGLYCAGGEGGGDGSTFKGYAISTTQWNNEIINTEENLRRFTENMEDGTVLFIYDETRAVRPN